MNLVNSIIVIVFIVLLFLFLAYIIKRLKKKIKKNESIKNDIPTDVLNDFNKAEEMRERSKGSMTPQEILFKIWADKNNIHVDKQKFIEENKKDFNEPKEEKKLNLGRLFGVRNNL